MTDFVFPDPIETQAWESAALDTANGVTAGNWTADDAGRALKLGTAQSYTECASGNEIDAFLMSVEPFTVADGKSFGSIKRKGRIQVKAGGAIAFGDYVVAGTAPARATVTTPASGTPAVVISGSPTKCLWRYIRLVKTAAGTVAKTASAASAAAASGDTILIERV
jgi:hypothetical protein